MGFSCGVILHVARIRAHGLDPHLRDGSSSEGGDAVHRRGGDTGTPRTPRGALRLCQGWRGHGASSVSKAAKTAWETGGYEIITRASGAAAACCHSHVLLNRRCSARTAPAPGRCMRAPGCPGRAQIWGETGGKNTSCEPWGKQEVSTGRPQLEPRCAPRGPAPSGEVPAPGSPTFPSPLHRPCPQRGAGQLPKPSAHGESLSSSHSPTVMLPPTPSAPVPPTPFPFHLRDGGCDFPLTPATAVRRNCRAARKAADSQRQRRLSPGMRAKIAASAKISQALSPPVRIYLE